MKIAIVGSRDFAHLAYVDDYVRDLPPETVIVSGGARGVDRRAEHAARLRGLAVDVHHADWGANGKGAGMIRNYIIVRECDRLVAFWDGVSRGTEHSINLAITAGKPVVVVSPDGTMKDVNT